MYLCTPTVAATPGVWCNGDELWCPREMPTRNGYPQLVGMHARGTLLHVAEVTYGDRTDEIDNHWSLALWNAMN